MGIGVTGPVLLESEEEDDDAYKSSKQKKAQKKVEKPVKFKSCLVSD
jgi:hypothetical protein